MDLKRIRHFVVLAETLSFRKAAERLHMTQPPLSVSIRKLEEALGVRLFERTPTGVLLTPSGHAALAEARRLLFHGTQFETAAQRAFDGTGGVLRIGFVGSTIHGLLQRLLTRYRAEQPGVELVLREATSTRIIEQIENETLDIGLVRTPLLHGSLIELLPLETDQFVAALPLGHRLAKRRKLALADLADEAFVMYSPAEGAGLHSAAMLACQQRGFLPRTTQQAAQIQTVLALVESGLGVALVPSVMQSFVRPGFVYRRLTDMPPSAAIGLALAWRPEIENAAAERFRAMAQREFV
ncbi:MAG: LysR family transcriptional regulator [Burkholderiales bacterium]|nr:LysR family transcriptional regulator [Burkholderiales bacterium]